MRTMNPTAWFGGGVLRFAAAASVFAVIAAAGLTVAFNRSGEASSASTLLGGGTIPYFSVVGSGGVVDDADAAEVTTNGAILQMTGTAPNPTTSVIRYPVYAVNNLAAAYNTVALSVRFRDNGSGAQVLVKLKEFDIGTGTETTRLTFDSNDSGNNNSFQTDSVTDDDSDWDFDFVEKAYFLEVTLKKTGNGGKPAVAAMQLIVFTA